MATLLRPASRKLLPQTGQFPASLWFGWLVAYGPASVDPKFVPRGYDCLYTFAAFFRKLWQSRHELPSCCHQMLRRDAPVPKRTTITNRGVYSSNGSQSLQASGVVQRTVCWSDAHKVSSILQLPPRSSNRVCVGLMTIHRGSVRLHVCPLTDEIIRGSGDKHITS